MKIETTIILIFLIIHMFNFIPSAEATEPYIEKIYLAKVIPIIDGKFGSNEWDDVDVDYQSIFDNSSIPTDIKVHNSSLEIFSQFKHNLTMLFGIIKLKMTYFSEPNPNDPDHDLYLKEEDLNTTRNALNVHLFGPRGDILLVPPIEAFDNCSVTWNGDCLPHKPFNFTGQFNATNIWDGRNFTTIYEFAFSKSYFDENNPEMIFLYNGYIRIPMGLKIGGTIEFVEKTSPNSPNKMLLSDIIPTSIRFEDSPNTKNYYVYCGIKNNGSIKANFYYQILDNDHLLSDGVISNLEPGKYQEVYGGNRWYPQPGNHELVCRADPDNILMETNESNNVLKTVFKSPNWADLVANQLVVEKRINGTNSTDYYIKAIILNSGERNATNFWVEIFLDNVSIFKIEIGNIPINGKYSIGVNQTISRGVHQIVMKIDTYNWVKETNKTNNQKTVNFEIKEKSNPDKNSFIRKILLISFIILIVVISITIIFNEMRQKK